METVVVLAFIPIEVVLVTKIFVITVFEKLLLPDPINSDGLLVATVDVRKLELHVGGELTEEDDELIG